MADTISRPEPALQRELGLRDLILFTIAGTVGVRWLAASAHVGPGAVVLWLLAIVLFYIPSAFAIATLAARYPREGGLYVWTKSSFGDWHGFLCAWVYWMGIVFWFPSAAIAFASMAVYMLGPNYTYLAEDRTYILTASLLIVWISLGANLIDLKFGKWTENLGGMAVYLIGAAIVVLAIILGFQRGPATPLHITSGWSWERVNFWSQIAYGLTGLELAPILGGEIVDPERNLPRAAWISAIFCGLFYVGGTIAMLVLLPAGDISPIHGLAQAANVAGTALHLPWLAPLMAGMILFGAMGQLGALGTASARLPLVLGVDSYLPKVFAKLHPRWHTPYVSILTLASVATFFLIAMHLGETVRAGYQVLVDLTVICGFIPFIYIFLSAWKNGRPLSAFLGLFVTGVAILASVVPTADVSSVWIFEIKLIGGTLGIVLVAWIVFNRRRP